MALPQAENEKSAKVTGLFGEKVINRGRDLVEAADLEFRELDNISPRSRLDILANAATNPGLLVGWQVSETVVWNATGSHYSTLLPSLFAGVVYSHCLSS